MQPQDTPFQTGWWSFDLGKYRPCDGTYCYYAYDSIPPLDSAQFDGKFAWLKPLAGGNPGAYAAPTPDTPIIKKLDKLKASAQKHNVTLPSPFLTFMQNTAWQDSIPSCTACYFDLSESLVPDPLQDEHYYIRFLNDQQDVLMWYLYLNAGGDSCVVVVSPVPLDEIEEQEIPSAAIKANTLYCAESFEAFIYRFWLENTIWFALDFGEAMTESQKAYLAHYQKP
jgi:hypothetical protein